MDFFTHISKAIYGSGRRTQLILGSGQAAFSGGSLADVLLPCSAGALAAACSPTVLAQADNERMDLLALRCFASTAVFRCKSISEKQTTCTRDQGSLARLHRILTLAISERCLWASGGGLKSPVALHL